MTENSAAGKTVSLVLGSGGARGLAHIGVINWLEEHDFQIVSVSGSSIGALVGGIYAIGKLEEFEHWVRAISTTDILRLLDLSFDRDGLVRGERIIETLRNLIGDSQIEDLPIPFTAVATNVAIEKEVWLNSGSLFDAIRASISLPMFFKPAVIDGVQLLDGGILNPVPIAPTFNDESDLTIAVNLCGRREPGFKLPVKKSQPEEDEEDDFGQKISDFIRGLDITKKVTAKRNGGMLDIASQTFDAMQGAIARQRLSAYPADIDISVSKSACKMLDFDRADELIQLGYELAERKLARL
jgi:NTE family protein